MLNATELNYLIFYDTCKSRYHKIWLFNRQLAISLQHCSYISTATTFYLQFLLPTSGDVLGDETGAILDGLGKKLAVCAKPLGSIL